MSHYVKDLVERVLWTAAQAGIAVLITSTQDWGTEWAVPIAAALAIVKGFVARQVGNHESASTVPEV